MSSKATSKLKTLILVFDHTKSHIALIQETEGKDHWEGSLNAIGGHVEDGEDIYVSAQRECKEELGIDADLDLKLLGIMHVLDKKGLDNLMFVFTTIINRKAELQGSSEGQIKWMKISTLNNNKNIVQDIKLFISVAQKISNTEYITGTSRYLSDGVLEYIQICKRQMA